MGTIPVNLSGSSKKSQSKFLPPPFAYFKETRHSPGEHQQAERGLPYHQW